MTIMARVRTFAVSAKYEAFYTGGKIEVSSDGLYMFCGCGNKVQVLDIKKGTVFQSIVHSDDEAITSFGLTPDNQFLIVANQHLILRQWNWRENTLIRSWKAIHIAAVTRMAFDSTSTLLATGSADATVKVWDVLQQYCTHNLRGHQGVISVVQFHPDIGRLQLFTAADDYKIRVWDLQTSSCVGILELHYSTITCLAFSKDGNTLLSSGRDSVVIVWDAVIFKQKKTIPVFESIEDLVLLPEGKYTALNVDGMNLCFVTAGAKGCLRVWSSETGRCLHTQNRELPDSSYKDETSHGITQAFLSEPMSAIATVSFDHNITFYNMEDFKLVKQFAGNNDEILDICFMGRDDTHIAVATNSEQIRVFKLESWNCQILYGHTDIVLSIDVDKTRQLLASSSKDNTIRVWTLCPDSERLTCVAVGQGHTHAVGSISFSKVDNEFIVSGSQDNTIKLWPIPKVVDNEEEVTFHAKLTEKAHDKDINSVTVSPNDKFIASGSQDRTAKLWRALDLSLLGVMRGHKRGLWCVHFSPVDQCLATGSTDGTVKLWSLSDYSCVKTFEGHDSSVLRVIFLTRGMQLFSSGSDGLLKLWTIKTNECVKTLDAHEDKIWAIACDKKDDTIITGGGDSSIIIWRDVTQTEIEEGREKQEEFILREQELSNLIQQKKYLKAIGLAIMLEQPFKVLKILKEILSETNGAMELEATLSKLRVDQLDAILRFCVQWNTNSRHCHEAQFVLSVVLRSFSPEDLLKFPNIKSTVEGLLPYTERHFKRMDRLLQQSMFVDYTWECMKSINDIKS